MVEKQTLRQKLEAKRLKLAEQIRRIDARETQRKRKDDTRRKIIAGSLALSHAEKDEEFRRVLYGLIIRYAQKPQDRALFGLEPLEETSGERETETT